MANNTEIRRYAFIERAKRYPFRFLKLVMTLDPHERKTTIRRRGKPFPYGKEYIEKLVDLWEKERYLYILKSRQMLMTWWAVSLYVWDTLVHPGRYTYFRSQQLGQAGSLKKGLTLLSRAKYIIERLPSEFLYSAFDKECEMTAPVQSPRPVWTLPNGSLIEPISQNPDDVRSPSATGVLDDETAFQPQAELAFQAIKPTLGVMGRYTGLTSINGKNYAFRKFYDIEDNAKFIVPSTETMQGFKERRNRKNKIYTVELHYTADPDKNISTEECRKYIDIWKGLEDVPKERVEWEKKMLADEGVPNAVKWYIQARQGYGDRDWEREMEINPSIFAGRAVFPEFSNQYHVVENLKINLDFPLLVGFDFGYHSPVMVVAQYNGSCLNILHEWTPTDINNQTFGYMVQQKLAIYKNKFRIRYYTGHEANRTHEDTGQTTSEIFSIMGIHLNILRKPDILRGIQKIRNLLHYDEFGEAKMKIDSECTTIIDGFRGGYRNKEQKNEENPQSEIPHKDGTFDHSMDAYRYLVDQNFKLDGSYYYTEEEERFISAGLIGMNTQQPQDVLMPYGLPTRGRKVLDKHAGY